MKREFSVVVFSTTGCGHLSYPFPPDEHCGRAAHKNVKLISNTLNKTSNEYWTAKAPGL